MSLATTPSASRSSSGEQSHLTIGAIAFVEKPEDEHAVTLEESEQWKPRHFNPLMEDWEVLQGDITGVGIVMFKRLFEIHPDMKDLFSFGHDPNLEINVKAHRHASLVLTTVGHVVSGYHSAGVLQGSLGGLGGLHAQQFGVKSHHFAPFGEALLYAVEHKLPRGSFTADKKAAWQAVFNEVACCMGNPRAA